MPYQHWHEQQVKVLQNIEEKKKKLCFARHQLEGWWSIMKNFYCAIQKQILFVVVSPNKTNLYQQAWNVSKDSWSRY